MMTFDALQGTGLFQARLPRYTSYPTAPIFSEATRAEFQAHCLEQLNPDEPVSVYIHIPFCERLCWFCACRTQGVRSSGPVESYLSTLLEELELVRARLPKGLRMGQLHWGGGTPTILKPEMIETLSKAVFDVFPKSSDFEFSVEIDPTLVDEDKIAALAAAGMARASIGVQDFATHVQEAIGREQSFEVTHDCVRALRAAGVTSLNLDLVYGLPGQTQSSFMSTLGKVDQLDPDRIALFGYAHVPQMAKRQRLIPETLLPDDRARFELFGMASQHFRDSGMRAIGIDHFAKPEDSLCQAAEARTLRRNFQGYTTDRCPTLIGIGASSISKFKQGYVQNEPHTGRYNSAIRAGDLAGVRGHEMTPDDVLRGRIIEMLMCDFEIDLDALQAQFGPLDTVRKELLDIRSRFWPHLEVTAKTIRLREGSEPLVRLIANAFDAHRKPDALYSKVS
ncbi:MAG: oxygen-independent coproporphyrinogen III oxidase [Litoreibacter sp.]|nr:oxygen-independent coproporphyrinogen III oxidase [Litoreibacter sp.]